MGAMIDASRRVVSVSGEDAQTFLQGLVSNDVGRAAADRAVYAAMLTPQGKFLFDMLILRPEPTLFWLDVAADQADALAARLGMYRLRAAVEIAPSPDLQVAALWGGEAPSAPPADGVLAPDPRDAALGHRAIAPDVSALAAPATPESTAAYQRLRIERAVPMAGSELIAKETFPLEAGFERVNGVDFKKGCYVGQEVTARMRHKAVLKKALKRLRVTGAPPPPGAEVRAGDRPAGVLGAAQDGLGLAVLRIDRLSGDPLSAGEATLEVLEDPQENH